MPPNGFSALMAVYRNEKPAFFEQALNSLLRQTLPPSEVVLVQDGPVSSDLSRIIARYAPLLNIKLVQLEHNVGLGAALTEGLRRCTHAWVARCDSDDINVPERFERQTAFAREHADVDLVGAWISEFSTSPSEVESVRAPPEDHGALVSYAKKRNPFNHMTVYFRKDAIERAGGYQSEYMLEDYSLWVRAIMTGAKLANIPETLVYARSGDAMIRRRGGAKYALAEMRITYSFWRQGFVGFFEMLFLVATRVPVRLLPHSLRKMVYRSFLR